MLPTSLSLSLSVSHSLRLPLSASPSVSAASCALFSYFPPLFCINKTLAAGGRWPSVLTRRRDKVGREERERGGDMVAFVPVPCHLIKMRNSLPEMSISANDRGHWGGWGERLRSEICSRSYKLK